MPTVSKEFELEGAQVALQEVVELHRQHRDDAHNDDTRARLVSAVRGMEWTMQDLEDYGQCTDLSAAALDFQEAARATILEARQTLVSSATPRGQCDDSDVRSLSLAATCIRAPPA
jgi:non-ribosomal peptide synthetase component F